MFVMIIDGRPHSIARELLQDATMWSGGLSESAKHVNVTCAEDTTVNEDKQCLQRDVTESRCLEEGCGKNMLDVCYDLMSYDAGQWLEFKRAMCQTLRMQSAVELEALLMARTQCQTEYVAMVNTGNECQLQGYMLHGELVIVVSCAEVLFQPSFPYVK